MFSNCACAIIERALPTSLVVMALNSLNLSSTSDLCFLKYIAQYRGYLSINVTKYFARPIDSVCIEPQTSLCTNCSRRVERISPTEEKGFQWSFPSIHPSQKESSVTYSTLIPFTNIAVTLSCCTRDCYCYEL